MKCMTSSVKEGWGGAIFYSFFGVWLSWNTLYWIKVRFCSRSQKSTAAIRFPISIKVWELWAPKVSTVNVEEFCTLELKDSLNALFFPAECKTQGVKFTQYNKLTWKSSEKCGYMNSGSVAECGVYRVFLQFTPTFFLLIAKLKVVNPLSMLIWKSWEKFWYMHSGSVAEYCACHVFLQRTPTFFCWMQNWRR